MSPLPLHFSTGAIQLDPCSDLSYSAFPAAFSYFVGRRGLPQSVVTDNSRKFFGASRELKHKFNVLVKSVAQDIARKFMMYE